jgi:predicted transcriptional regulator
MLKLMEIKQDISITTQHDGMTDTVFASSFSPEEQEDILIAKSNSKKVFSPEFIPFRKDIMDKYGLTHIETILYGFIRFYTTNSSDRFYFTNEQLGSVVGCSGDTAGRSVSTLIKVGLIVAKRRVKAGGGQIRFIEQHNFDSDKTGRQTRIKLQTNKNNINNILSKDNSTKYGNVDINKFIEKINSLLDIKLPEDYKSRMVVSNMLKLLSRHEKRLWLKENKWDNAKDWFDQYHQTNLSKGFYPRSWYKVYENLKLWIANEGDLSKLNKK